MRTAGTHLEGERTSMLGDQEIGEVDKVGEARIEQQVPNNLKILSG